MTENFNDYGSEIRAKGESTVGVVEKKGTLKKKRTDLIVLCFIALLVLVIMSVATAFNNQKLVNAEAEKAKDSIDNIAPNVGTIYLDDDGNLNVTQSSEVVEKEKEPWEIALDNAVKTSVRNNVLYCTDITGNVSSFDMEEWSFVYEEISLEEEAEDFLREEDDKINRALKAYASNKVAFAATTNEISNVFPLAKDSYRTVYSGGWAQESGTHWGNGGHWISANLQVSLNVGSFFGRVLNERWTVQFQQGGSCTNNGSMSISTGNPYNGSPSSVRFNWSASSYADGGGRKCGKDKEGSRAYATISGAYVNICHKIDSGDTSRGITNPAWKYVDGDGISFKNCKRISFDATFNNVYAVSGGEYYYVTENGGGRSGNKGISFKNGVNGQGYKKITANAQWTYGDVEVQVKNQANVTYRYSQSAAAMRLDNTKPTISAWISTNGLNAESVTNQTQTMTITVSDPEGSGRQRYSSGINDVYANNNTLGYKVDKNKFTVNGGTYTFSVPANKLNGNWTFTVTDRANNKSETTLSYWYYDGSKPQISNVSFANDYGQSPVITSDGKYTNTPVKMTFRVTDVTNTKDSSSNELTNSNLRYGAVTVNVRFKVNDTTYVLSNNTKSLVNGVTLKSYYLKLISGNAKDGTYACYLPYSQNVIQDNFAILAKDKINQSDTYTVPSSSQSIKIDSIAPEVTEVRAINNGDKDTYSASNVKIAVTVKDYSHQVTPDANDHPYYVSEKGRKFDNGSGVRALYFFKDTALTQPLNVFKFRDETGNVVAGLGEAPAGISDYSITQAKDVRGNTIAGRYNQYLFDSAVGTNMTTATFTILGDTVAIGLSNVYVVAEDNCGNLSAGFDSSINKSSSSTKLNTLIDGNGKLTNPDGTVWDAAPKLKSNGWAGSWALRPYTGYKGSTAIYRDTYKPEIVIYDATNQATINQVTNGINAGNLTAAFSGVTIFATTSIYVDSSNGANTGHLGNAYVLPIGRSDVKIGIVILHGASGGTLKQKMDGGTETNVQNVGKSTSGTKISLAKSLDGTRNILSDSQKPKIYNSNGCVEYLLSESLAETNTIASYGVTHLTRLFNKEGVVNYEFFFETNSQASSAKKRSESVQIVTQIDRTPPTVTLEHFSNAQNAYVYNAANCFTVDGMLKGQNGQSDNWFDATGMSLYAIFSVNESAQFISAPNAYLMSSSSGKRAAIASVQNNVMQYGAAIVTRSGNNTVSAVKSVKDANGNLNYRTVDKTSNKPTYTNPIDGTQYGNYSQASKASGVFWAYSYTGKNNKTYQGVNYEDLYATESGGRFYYALKVYNIDELGISRSDIKKSVDADEKTWLRYGVCASDLAGNVGTCAVAKVKTSFNTDSSTRLRFFIEPIKSEISDVTLYTVPGSYDYTSGNVGKDFAPVGGTIYYKKGYANNVMSNLKQKGWTKDQIILVATHTSGFSPTTFKYDTVATAYNNSNSATSPLTRFNKEKITLTNVRDVSNNDGDAHWIAFEVQKQRDIQVGIALFNGATKESYTFFGMAKATSDYFVVKQDAIAPRLRKVFFATEPSVSDVADSRCLLAYDAQLDNKGNYTFTLDEANSHTWNTADGLAWTKEDVYVYFLISDEGSGIRKDDGGLVKIVDKDDVFNYKEYNGRDKETGDFLYCSIYNYGYRTRNDSNKNPIYNIFIKDNVGNVTELRFGGEGKFPVIDDVQPTLELVSTDPANTKMDGDRVKLVGEAIRYEQFKLKYKYTTGISGWHIYYRLRTYGEDYNDDVLSVWTKGYLPYGYDLAANGWGSFIGAANKAVFTPGKCSENGNIFDDLLDPAKKAAAKRKIDAYENKDLVDKDAEVVMAINSIKNRLDFIIVSGTGAYYVIEAGDLFIDTEAPTVYAGGTIFGVTEDTTYPSVTEIDYNSIQKIWSEKVDDYYTDGNVYVYYSIADGASGVNDASVIYNKDRLLQKVIVRGVPVCAIDGVPTEVRYFNGTDYKVTVVDNRYYINGYKTRLQTVSGAANKVSATTADITYYRLLIDAHKDALSGITIAVSDISGNEVLAKDKPVYELNIDVEPVRLIADMWTENKGGAEYEGTRFTNKDVAVNWYVETGSSRFGMINYVENGNARTIKLPDFTFDASGNVIATIIDKGKTVSRSLGKLTAVKVVVTQIGSNYKWKINGSESNFSGYVDTTEYDVTALSLYNKVYTFDLVKHTLNVDFVVPKHDGTIAFENIVAFNRIEDEYAKGRVRPESESKTCNVKQDVTAPNIDVTKGTLPELTSSDWHALAKSVKAEITDNLSGIAKLQQCNPDTGEFYDNVYIISTDDRGSTLNGKFVLNDDNYYRAYNMKAVNGDLNFMKEDGLIYLDKRISYTIVAIDEAGNKAELAFTPNIDEKKAELSNLTVYTNGDGNVYKQGEDSIKVEWLKHVSTDNFTPVNWANDYFKVTLKVTYGEGGYVLQRYEADREQDLGARSNAWINASGYVIASTVSNSDGTKTDSLEYYIGKNDRSLYKYFRFRALSKGELTELGYDGGTRATLDATGNAYRLRISIVDSVEKADRKSRNDKYGIDGEYFYKNLGARQDTDLLAMDRAKPSLSVKNVIKDTDKAYGAAVNGGTEWKIGNDWAAINAVAEVGGSSDSDFTSGRAFFYRTYTGGAWSDTFMVFRGIIYKYGKDVTTGEYGWINQQAASDKLNVGDTYGMRTDLKTNRFGLGSITWTVSDSTNNEVYEIYTINGAGEESNRIRIGHIENEGDSTQVVYGVKIDITDPRFEVITRTTNKEFVGDAMSIQSELDSEFKASLMNGYTNTGDAKFTKANTVMVAISLDAVGYSGIDIMYDGKVFAHIDYKEKLEETDKIKYYYIDANGENEQDIILVSGANRNSGHKIVHQRIDNTTPILYVKGVTATKATNWGWNSSTTMKNLYTDEVEYWYTSDATIDFGIGIIEKGVFQARNPYSGFVIEYRIIDKATNKVKVDWTTLGKNVTRKVIEEASGDRYVFRITSNPEGIDNGMKDKYDHIEYELGKEIRDNQNRLTYVNDVNEDILNVAGVTPITAHVIANGAGDYADGSYFYDFYINSNNFNYNYESRVFLGKDTYDVNTDKFGSYVVERYENGVGFVPTTVGQIFKYGDVLRIRYTAYNDKDFYQFYTTSSHRNNSETFREDVLADSRKDKSLESSGEFLIQFRWDNVSLIADYIAEVEVEYGDDVFFLQGATDDEQIGTTGKASYEYLYRDSSGNEYKSTIVVQLEYAYRHNGLSHAAATMEELRVVDAYVVTATVTQGTGNFRTKNPEKNFVVKYFDEVTVGSQVYFCVYSAKDFGYVDNEYYDLFNDAPLLKSYNNGKFKLNNDIALTVNETLSGEFNGSFDGKENKITLIGGAINGTFGLFETVGKNATICNLTVEGEANDKVTIDADNAQIGLLAAVMNGTAYNVSVKADVEIARLGVSGETSNFGGVFGKVTATAKIGGVKGTVYSDVRITNNGSRALTNANVSAFVGKVESGAQLSSAYVFGEVTIYNASGVNVGIVYGDIDVADYTTGGAEVAYFDKNTFYNDETVTGVSNSVASQTAKLNARAMGYEEFAESSLKVGGLNVKESILTRLYGDFGLTYTAAAANGKGTENEPFVIPTSVDENGSVKSIGLGNLKVVDNYMNLHFLLDDTSGEKFDASDVIGEIAIHKVFNGSLTSLSGNYMQFDNLGGAVGAYENELFGLFGRLNGKVSKIVFGNIGINVNYVGENEFHAGLVAAIGYENAEVSDVIFIGTESIKSVAKVYAGTVFGKANGSMVYDVFNINNITVSGNNVVVGGMIGKAQDVVTYNAANKGAIYLLGRVEARGEALAVGGVLGSGVIAGNASNVYTIASNTYSGGLVLEEKPVGSKNGAAFGINTVRFDDEGMRQSTAFSSGNNAFDIVFNGFYPLEGDGRASNPFKVKNETDFANINLALYATYSITESIRFTEFETIGMGLVFSGEIKGSGGSSIGAEESNVASLTGMTGPLVYNNAGTITDLGLNITCTYDVLSGEEFFFGGVATYNSGTIKSITISGEVTVNAASDSTLYVSGFVGESRGGTIDTSKIQNSISNLVININGGGTVYVGGYAGVVSGQQATFSYGIATGEINIFNAQRVYAGLFVGLSYGDCDWQPGEAASVDYTYTIRITDSNGNVKEIDKVDVDGNPIRENYIGYATTRQ